MNTNMQNDEKTVIAPPIEVIETGGSLCMTCQLQGVPEEDIRIDLEKGQLILSVSKQDAAYLQKIIGPDGSRITGKKFRDGILEITLK